MGAGHPPNTPNNLTASDGTNCIGVDLNWGNVNGATHYKVFRSQEPQFSTATRISPPLLPVQSNYTDNLAIPGVTYYYWVTAVRSLCLPGNDESPHSNRDSGYAGALPNPPSYGLRATAANSNTAAYHIEIPFLEPAGGVSYELWRSPTPQRLDGESLGGGAIPFPGQPGWRFFEDFTAILAYNWTYWVRASNPCGTSAWSNPVTYQFLQICPPGFEPNPCGNLSLCWEPLYQASQYKVYRDGVYQPPAVPGGESRWEDTTSTTGVHSYQLKTEYTGGGSDWSDFVQGEYIGAPAPANFTASDGTDCTGVQLSWDAVGMAISYRIYRDNDQIATLPGTNLAFHDVPPVPGQVYIYWIKADNAQCLGQRFAYDDGSMPFPLSIPTQPLDATACSNGSAPFSIAAGGTGAFAYQWQIETAPGTWTDLSTTAVPLTCGGSAIATAPTLSQTDIAITPCPGVNAYAVRCVVSDDCGNIPSNPAIYSVCYANCDCSATPPTLNVLDFACFLNRFAAGNPYANCDGSTTPPTINVLDFACFLNKFAAGCP